MKKELLNKMLKLIEEKHLDMYFNITKEELNNYIEEVLKKYELKDEYDFYYVANVIIKKIFGIYDSHTKLVWKDADFNLPIRLKYIDGKIFVIRVTDDNKDLLYSEVLSINNIPIERLVDEIEKMTAYSTNEYLYTQIENILYNGIKLKSLPSIKSDSNSFEFEILKDDQIIKRNLTKSEGYLLPINKPQPNYSYKIINDKIYIVYNACREEHEGQMKEFVKEIKKVSEENNINKYIIDIRGNRGGNSNIINPLIDYLSGKEAITLVDEYVFSGGRWAVFDLKNIGSKFVGTGIGTSMNCFGDAPINDIDKFILPISYKYFYFDKDCNRDSFKYSVSENQVTNINLNDKYFIPFEEMKKNKDYFIPQIFEPDYYVKNSIDDYKNGYDRQLDSAIKLLDLKKSDVKGEFANSKTR